MTKYTRFEKTKSGEYIEVHFEDHRRTAETRKVEKENGTYYETRDSSGAIVGSGFRKKGSNWRTNYDSNGKHISDSLFEEGHNGKIERIYDLNGNLISDGRIERGKDHTYRVFEDSTGSDLDMATRSERPGRVSGNGDSKYYRLGRREIPEEHRGKPGYWKIIKIQKGIHEDYREVFVPTGEKPSDPPSQDLKENISKNDYLPRASRVKDHEKIKRIAERHYPAVPERLPSLIITPDDSQEEIERVYNSGLYLGFTAADNYENTYKCSKCGHTWKNLDVIDRPEMDCPKGCSDESSAGFFESIRCLVTGKPVKGVGELIESADRRKKRHPKPQS